MTVNTAEITAAANAVLTIANNLKAVEVLIAEFLGSNSENDPNWSSIDPSAVDANGYVLGTTVLPTDISNAIGSLTMFSNYWNGQAVTTSAWGNNIQKIAKPLV